MPSKSKKINYYRIVLQYVILALLAYMVIRAWVDPGYIADYEAYCPIGGMQAYSSYLVSNTLACSMTTLQIAMGFALIIGVILISKLFCSYLCPIGTFTEWLGRMGEKLKVRLTIRSWADKVLRLLKYVLLFLTFYFTINSSELFCRQYDPFYAVFSGFTADVVLWYALIALAVTILGSFFIRQFWCKYLCPLGAVTNLFAFTLLFLGITALYLLLNWIPGVSIPWIWYLGTLCLGGFIREIWKPDTWLFPLLKVTRHDDRCTHCKICDKVCPYDLNISTVEKVTHIDCHLCGDCVTQCPEEGALKYNARKLRWLPPAGIILLVAAGIILSSNTEIPTIDLKWADSGQMAKAGVYEQSGLMSIKCFGSSMSFANQMKEVPGILGVQTFVKHHAVKIFYDTAVIDAEGIKEAMFTAVREIISLPEEKVTQLSALYAGIDHFFDPADASYLTELLKSRSGIFGFETHYGEPVKTLIYYDGSKLNAASIKSLIETRELTLKVNESTRIQKLDFDVAWMKDSAIALTRNEFLQGLFTPYSKTFNDYEKSDTTALAVYETDFFECLYPEKQDFVPYLRNHIMADKGIKKFETYWKEDKPMLRVSYDATKTTPASILLSLTQPKLHIIYKNGETEDMENPFTFKPVGNLNQ